MSPKYYRLEEPTMTSDLSVLTDADLTRAVNRAWREASRCWQEYRSTPKGSPIRPMMLTAAEAAEAWWSDLHEEQEARLTEEQDEVLSTDVSHSSYVISEGASR